jgi:hypothetical protein
MKIIIYTCITARYDWLLPPLFQSKEIEYICFTDTPNISAHGWSVRPIADSIKHLPPNLINRHYKFFPHFYLPESEWSIYIDGNLRLFKDLGAFVEDMEDQDIYMACPRHPQRNNIFDEAEACLQLGKFSSNEETIIQDQLEFYRSEGMPPDLALSANYILVRKHSEPLLQKAMVLWWDQLQAYTKRDQISLPYAAWKTGLSLTMLEISSGTPNDYYFGRVLHRKPGIAGARAYLGARRFEGEVWRKLDNVVSRIFSLFRAVCQVLRMQ